MVEEPDRIAILIAKFLRAFHAAILVVGQQDPQGAASYTKVQGFPLPKEV